MSIVQTDGNSTVVSPIGATYGTIHFFAFILALYLSFQRNNGFDLLSFLVACICPYIYIIYYFATR